MIDDNNIIKQVLDGKKDHYSLLMDKYHNELFKYIYNVTNNYTLTEDVLQEVFIKIYNKLHKYNSDIASFRTWMYKVASNHTLNYVNSKQYKDAQLLNQVEEQYLESTIDIEAQLIKDERMNQIITVIRKKLKPKHQKIMYLHYFSGLTVKEISKALDIPHKTIYKALESSIRKIRSEVTMDE